MVRPHVLAILAAIALSTAACGGATSSGAAGPTQPPGDAGDAAAACAEGTTDCNDTPQLTDDEPVQIDETGIAQFAADAQYYLGRDESELTDQIRVGRRGDESFALTEDYRVGRMTVELDDLDTDGTYVVTAVTVELPDGPETFRLDN